MTTPTATVAPDLPTPCAYSVLPRSKVRTAVVAVLVVALLLVAVLALAAMIGLEAELAALALLGSWAGVGVIVVMAGLPLLRDGGPLGARRAFGRSPCEHPDREHT